MRIFISLLFILLNINIANSETAVNIVNNDTILLQEIEVKPHNVIHKSDCILYIPTEEIRKNSTNGFSLLQNMMLPTLTINTILETIESPLGKVEVQINGRQSSITEIKGLDPKSIIRIEYNEDPGLKNRDVNTIVNLIVKNPSSGGSFTSNILYWLHDTPSGNLFLDLKLNHNNNQFGLYIADNLRKDAKIYREYNEKLTFPNGITEHRKEKPLGGLYNSNQSQASVYYTYNNHNKTLFWANISFMNNMPETQSYKGIITSTDNNDSSFIFVENKTPLIKPKINFYLEQSLGDNQTIMADFVAEINHSKSQSSHIENNLNTLSSIYNYQTSIKETNQHYGVAIDYIKKQRNSKITIGNRWHCYLNKSKYKTFHDSTFHQRYNQLFAFAEYQHYIGDFSISASIGYEYSDFRLKETNTHNTLGNYTPQLSASWRKKWSTLRLIYYQRTILPSLNNTNPTVQQIDKYQIHIGNPNLKAYNHWLTNLIWHVNLNRTNSSAQIGYSSTSNNAFAPIYYWDNDKLVTTFTNGHRNSLWWLRFSSSIELIPKWLRLNGTIDMTRYYTHGDDYNHCNTSWSGNVETILTYKNFMLYFQYTRAKTQLTDEMKYRNESFNVIQLQYNLGKINLGIGIMMPLGRYNQEKTLLNKYYSYHQIMRSNFIEKMGFIKLNYNINWGEQKNVATKTIDASGETMTTKSVVR